MITQAAVQPLNLEGIRKLVGDGFTRYPLISGFYLNQNSSKKRQEFDREVTGYGPLQIKEENKGMVMLDPKVGREKTYTHVTFGAGVGASWEGRSDELYGFVRRHLNGLGLAANETVNIEQASLFDRADSGDAAPFTGFDGLALLHATHTNLDASDTLTYKSNRLTLDISDAMLQTALIQFEKVRDAADNRISMGQKTMLVYAPDNMHLIKQLLNSNGIPFQNTDTPNVLMGQFEPRMLTYATAAKRWLLIKENHDLNFFMRTAPVVDSYEDKITKAIINDIRLRFTLGFGEWRPVIGSPGT